MIPVDDLFGRYREAVKAGEDPDPRPYLAQVRGVDRRELSALIDHFLAEHAPPRRFDRAAFERDPLARRLTDSLAAAATRESWVTLLPRARDKAEITRGALVRALAEELGVPDRERKVGDYYHEMETGALAPEGVSERVLEALGRIVRVPLERLREAGSRVVPRDAGGPAAVFARTAAPLQDSEGAAAADADAAPEWDEVDELFRGGR